MSIREFRIKISPAAIADLQDRIRRTRWPTSIPGLGWSRGVPPDYLRGLAERWLSSYEWQDWEAALNAYPQGTDRIDGQTIHFLHVRSPVPSAMPLVLTHGWPGSIVEFMKVLGPLTDPGAHGGDPADAFHVVAPSVPGFGFSIPVEEPGWNHRRIARAWATLMSRLGYDRYGAQGGDTGSIVSPALGAIAPDRVIAVHINGGLAFPVLDPTDLARLTPVERSRLAAAERLRAVGTGYADLQSTRPQTIGFALNDSPIGQLAWMVEKFQEWTDPARPLPEDAVDIDQLLTNASLYWFTGTGASSAHLYYETRAESIGRSEVPTGVAVFPTDPAIRRIVERSHNVVHWSEFSRGGHFAAMEAPDLLVQDIREFFRAFR